MTLKMQDKKKKKLNEKTSIIFSNQMVFQSKIKAFYNILIIS